MHYMRMMINFTRPWYEVAMRSSRRLLRRWRVEHSKAAWRTLLNNLTFVGVQNM
jgi:hypothetical protein